MEVPQTDSSIERLFSPAAIRPFYGTTDVELEVTQLFDDLREPLLRYLLSFGLSLPDGEEVIQEVFLSLFLHLRNGKPRSNLRGWIFRVGHNLGLRRRGKNQRALKVVVGSAEGRMETHLDAGPDPEQHVSSLQWRERLLAIVQALPEQDRQCLFLRAEGLRYREIAGVLGISLAGVAISLARSLARLSNAEGR